MKKSKLLDFDPESLLDPAPSSSGDENSDFESEEETQAGREHYADVGKSKLRKKEVVPLGPQYTGSRISRDDVEDEDSDDPFARGLEDSEGESDGEIANGDGAEIDDESGDDEEAFDIEDVDSDEEMENGSEDQDEDDEDEEDDEDDEDEDEDSNEGSGEDENDQNVRLREMMRDTTLVASTLSKAAQVDIEKGNAIKKQRKTFDNLLNSRIRLQKALISTNSMASEPHNVASAPEPAIEAAEAAALTLLNNLTDLRSTLDEARTGQKRKRPAPFTPSTTSSEILSHLTTTESSNLPHRHAILEKWSAKTRGAALSSTKGRLTNGTAQQTLTDVLRAQLQDPTRLIARTQVPRSCAPLHSATNIPSESIYDDADFYGLMLKQLLENRSSELNANGSASEFVVQAPWQVAREAKTKKVVDTKASKGRKLRYTVHEKLQNFMAPEERGGWGERQRDELFGGLFGRRVGLGEEEDGKSEEEEIDAEEEGLMLFRS